jgi:hypothetical protein
MRLMGLNCAIRHRRGKQNLVADALSRAPVQSNVAVLRERLVDDLLPIEDPPFEPRLSFAIEDVSTPEHMCTRCTSASVLQQYDKQDNSLDSKKETSHGRNGFLL